MFFHVTIPLTQKTVDALKELDRAEDYEIEVFITGLDNSDTVVKEIKAILIDLILSAKGAKPVN